MSLFIWRQSMLSRCTQITSRNLLKLHVFVLFIGNELNFLLLAVRLTHEYHAKRTESIDDTCRRHHLWNTVLIVEHFSISNPRELLDPWIVLLNIKLIDKHLIKLFNYAFNDWLTALLNRLLITSNIEPSGGNNIKLKVHKSLVKVMGYMPCITFGITLWLSFLWLTTSWEKHDDEVITSTSLVLSSESWARSSHLQPKLICKLLPFALYSSAICI